jgi:Helix-turn-helix domain
MSTSPLPTETTWDLVTVDDAPWFVQLEWAKIDDRFECVSVTVRSYRDVDQLTGALNPIRPLLGRDGGGMTFGPPAPLRAVSPSMMRQLRFGSIIDRSARGQAAMFAAAAELASAPSTGASPWSAGADARRPRRGSAITAEQLALVAEAYKQGGNRPRAAVASAFRISTKTAEAWIKRARVEGLLPRVSRGHRQRSQFAPQSEAAKQ